MIDVDAILAENERLHAVGAVLAENERLRAFVLEQNDQLLAANRHIEALDMKILAMELDARNLREQVQSWKSEWHAADRRLNIVREAQIEAGLLPWRSQYSISDMEACTQAAQVTGAKI